MSWSVDFFCKWEQFAHRWVPHFSNKPHLNSCLITSSFICVANLETWSLQWDLWLNVANLVLDGYKTTLSWKCAELHVSGKTFVSNFKLGLVHAVNSLRMYIVFTVGIWMCRELQKSIKFWSTFDQDPKRDDSALILISWKRSSSAGAILWKRAFLPTGPLNSPHKYETSG